MLYQIQLMYKNGEFHNQDDRVRKTFLSILLLIVLTDES